MSARLSVCLRASSPLLLDRFEYNLTLQTVIEIRRENPNLVKIVKNVEPFRWKLERVCSQTQLCQL